WTSNATSTGVWPDPTCLMISSFPCRFWTTWTAVAPDPVLTFRTNATPLVSRIAPLDRQTTSSDHPARSGSATVHQARWASAAGPAEVEAEALRGFRELVVEGRHLGHRPGGQQCRGQMYSVHGWKPGAQSHSVVEDLVVDGVEVHPAHDGLDVLMGPELMHLLSVPIFR